MRPVVPEEIGDLLKWRPLMLFNKTLLGPAYIESVVSCSPALIASQGGKRLPLEVWYMIIDFSSRSPETHRYSLVRPKLLRKSAGGDELVCERYQRWLPFGNIKHLKGIEVYHFYLAHPDNLYHSNRDPLYPNPFYYPFSHFSPCTFPTALLASKTRFLHVELTVPDVIKYLEDGYCSSCYGKHVVGSEIVLGTSPRWTRFSQLLGESITVFPPGLFICPLCVGFEHAWESIDAWGSHNLTGQEYNSWLLDRLESLGYEGPRLEDLPDSIEWISRLMSGSPS